jgi:hypothetical protein
MSESSDQVRLQVLLRTPSRNAKGRAEVEAKLEALGFEVTGSGQASVSARAAPSAFAAVFGGSPPAAGRSAPADRDLELTVPAGLADSVESISVAPQHIIIETGLRARKPRGET